MLESEIKGFWKHTWEKGSVPSDSTLCIAFNGWTNPDTALQESDKVKKDLIGEKYISLGGGNHNGYFTGGSIDGIIDAIGSDRFFGYDGIAFDIEVGDSGLINKFQDAFVASKKRNLKVLVTISHAAPYGVTDAQQLMHALIADEKVDYLSPQLYSRGNETENDFTENKRLKWTDYAAAKAAIIPSVVQANLYPDAQDYFKERGVNTKGFIQWSQISSAETVA